MKGSIKTSEPTEYCSMPKKNYAIKMFIMRVFNHYFNYDFVPQMNEYYSALEFTLVNIVFIEICLMSVG